MADYTTSAYNMRSFITRTNKLASPPGAL